MTEKPGERIDDLQYGGLKIIQNPAYFCFGTDSVLLAAFTRIKKGETVADLGSGGGILSILLGGKNPAARIYALEIQEALAELARRSVEMNGLLNVKVVRGDLKEAHRLLPRCQAVICNPPYDRPGTGKLSASESCRLARHEILCTFADVARAAGRLLGDGGRFYCINRAERLAELAVTLKEHHLQPKELRFIHADILSPAKYLLLLAVKNGGPGLRVLKPLIVYDSDGNYTAEVQTIYTGGK